MTNRIGRKLRRGFTIVEMLVSVFLLITAVAGPLTLAARGITASAIAKDQVTAFNLAQDAIEFVRFARDTNKLLGANWLTGAGASDPSKATDLTYCFDQYGCYVDSTGNLSPNPNDCSGTLCTPSLLRYDTAANRYTHRTSGANLETTIFTRRVYLDTSLGSGEVVVTAIVLWCYTGSGALTCNSNPNRKEVQVRENLRDWQ